MHILPLQAGVHVWRLVQEHTELLGGILGDEPGGGKTRQGLGLWTTHIHHINNYVNVTSFWEN